MNNLTGITILSLRHRHLGALRQFLLQAPTSNAYALGWLETHGVTGYSFGFWGVLQGAKFIGAALTISDVTFCLSHGTPEAARAIGREIAQIDGELQSILGPASMVQPCRPEVDEPDDVIVMAQSTYGISERPTFRSGEPLLREAHLTDIPTLVEAGLAMHAEEAGRPVPEDREGNYAKSVDVKVRSSRAWVVRDPYSDALLFKAAIAPASPEVALMEGVWVAPSHRGRGLATRCVHQLTALLTERHRHVALHVADDNAAAIALYTRLGFERRGDYACALYGR